MEWAPRTLALVGVWAVAFSCGDDPAVPPVGAKDAGTDATVDATAAWDGHRIPYEAAAPPSVPRVAVSAEMVSQRVDAQGMLFAAGEMQIGGEPFAQFFGGRNLAFYDRTFLPPDQYLLPVGTDSGVFDSLLGSNVEPLNDLFGFSTAVESYEYSKYHMNSIVEFSGAGVSLASGPLVAKLGPSLEANLVTRVGQLLTLAGTDVSGCAVLPAPQANPLNILGFAGLMPTFAPYSAFDPSVPGSTQVIQSCNRAGGYGGIPTPGNETPEYECEYNQLHLTDAQLNHTLVPAVLGFATWKQALWAIDFAGRMHDSGSNPVNAIAPSDEARVGTAGNQVVGTDPPGAAAGTYIGSTPLEGMWGLVMVTGMDNLDEWALSALTTADGSTLGGFASKLQATSYDYTSPLRWFPAAITVTVDASQDFPPVKSLALADPTSRSVDLSALLLGNAMFFSMTDSRNAGVGGTHSGLPLLFDGQHTFPADDGLPSGENTAHDRALAMLRVAFVDLERIHADPSLGLLNDEATISGNKVTQSSSVRDYVIAHALVGLRQTILSLDAASTQYGAADESPSADAQGILNSIPIHPPSGGSPPFCTHVRDVFVTNATFVRDVLTTSAGHVANGATIANGQATASVKAQRRSNPKRQRCRALTRGMPPHGRHDLRGSRPCGGPSLCTRPSSASRRACSEAWRGAPTRWT